jgi:hypothetical protein
MYNIFNEGMNVGQYIILRDRLTDGFRKKVNDDGLYFDIGRQ